MRRRQYPFLDALLLVTSVARTASLTVSALRAAIAGSGTAVIDLENASYLLEGTPLSIPASSFITLRGGTLDAQHRSRVLDVAGAVVLDGVIMVNGNATFTPRLPPASDAAAVVAGGGVFVHPTGNLTVVGGRISDCAAVLGSAIYCDGGAASITGTILTSCTTSIGGVMVVDRGHVSMADCIVDGMVGGSGVAFEVAGGASLTVKSTSISRCRADSHGVARIARGSAAARSRAHFRRCAVSEIVVRGEGGAFVAEGWADLALVDTTVNDAVAADGAGFLVRDGALASLHSCQLTRCHATSNGGGGAILHSTAELSGGNVFDGCSANNEGGSLYMDGESAILRAAVGSAIRNSWAQVGGGIAVRGGATLTLASFEMAACEALLGGGIYLRDASAQLQASTFLDCVAYGALVHLTVAGLSCFPTAALTTGGLTPSSQSLC